MKSLILFAVVVMLAFDLPAQQDPLYAQYFNNPILINPAFAGSAQRLIVSASYRNQWSGITGGPTTFNMNTHMSIVDNKVGVGAIVSVDKLGESKTTQYGGVFSYKIPLSTYASLSFGMQAGIIQYETNMEGVHVLNPDPLFAPYSAKQFNTGAGVLLKNDRYLIGLSVPHLLPVSVAQDHTVLAQNLYLFGSYSFHLSERVELRPSTLLRMAAGTPISADLNLNVIYSKLYTAGLFVRNLNTVGVLAQVVVKKLRVGYVFELPGKESALNFNTHEISLALSLDVLAAHNHSAVEF